MMKCSDLTHYRHLDTPCNDSAVPFSNNTPSNNSCVNWNQYYSDCKAGLNNPFQGAISFDNIGLAWVAIFQVGTKVILLNFIKLFSKLCKGYM